MFRCTAGLSSAALRKWDITADTPTPPGGVILRKEGSNEPDGLLMETAFLLAEPGFPQATVNDWFKHVPDFGLQLLIQANGDAAIDMLLAAHECAAVDLVLVADRRTTAIHARFVRRDQLDKFSDHTDFNVTPTDQMFVLWTAVNRVSRSG
jgi:predicted amidohydrolase YtcJ